MLSKTRAKLIGAKGGRKRKKNLSPERRREIAVKAAETRWAKASAEAQQ